MWTDPSDKFNCRVYSPYALSTHVFVINCYLRNRKHNGQRNAYRRRKRNKMVHALNGRARHIYRSGVYHTADIRDHVKIYYRARF